MLIIFDLDDTLIDTSGTLLPLRARAALKKMVDKGLRVACLDEAYQMLQRLNSHAMSFRTTLEEFLELHEGTGEQMRVALKEVYERDEIDHSPSLVTGADKLIRDLSSKHNLALVTIGYPKIQKEKMRLSGLDAALFKKSFYCETSKIEAYEELANLYPGQQIVTVGDRIERDLVPAKRLGFKTIHLKWGRGLNCTDMKGQVDYTIWQLGEIERILPKIEEFYDNK